MTAFDLSARIKIALSGSDRVRYLSGQVTNDVAKATTEAAVAACITNAKGRLQGLVQIVSAPGGDAFWIDAHESLREELFARLDRYIIADDCELNDVSDDYRLWHVIGEEKPVQDALALARSTRLGVKGWDVWLQTNPDWEAASPAAIDDLRIDQLIPAWDAEATSDFFPADLGLDASAVDFHKGCYIGQEVISRMKMSGKSNWRLVQLSATEALQPGMNVFSPANTESPVGVVTTTSGQRALAVIRRVAASVGGAVIVAEAEKQLSIPGEITKTV